MSDDAELFFDDRFLERHAGSIIQDPAIAIVELVANAWDAWATRVDIVWPEGSTDRHFEIEDNGTGMSEEQFRLRWRTLDYDRIRAQGKHTAPPPEFNGLPPREPYGRNGKGRHAAFKFGEAYRVRTWRDGIEVTFEVRRSVTQPFLIERIARRENVLGHGTVISTIKPHRVGMSAETAREVIGTRFLADPNFTVTLNGTRITFDDVPEHQRSSIDIDVPGTASRTSSLSTLKRPTGRRASMASRGG